MKKKIAVIFCVLALGFSLASCGGKERHEFTPEKFKKVAEEHGLVVTEESWTNTSLNEDGEDIQDDKKTFLVATDKKSHIRIEYYVADDNKIGLLATENEISTELEDLKDRRGAVKFHKSLNDFGNEISCETKSTYYSLIGTDNTLTFTIATSKEQEKAIQILDELYE